MKMRVNSGAPGGYKVPILLEIPVVYITLVKISGRASIEDALYVKPH